MLKNKIKNLIPFSSFCCIILFCASVFSVACSNVVATNKLGIYDLSNVISFILKTVITFLLAMLAYCALDRLNKQNSNNKCLPFNKKQIIILTVLFSCIFIVYAIIFYPGICNWDTINQIYDLYTGDKAMPYAFTPGQEKISALMNDHHPVFDTVIFTAFYALGKVLGDAGIGIFIYVVLQSILIALSFSIMICAISRFKINNTYFIQCISIIVLAFNPAIALYAINMVKDSLYSLIYVLYLTIFFLIVLEGPTKKKLFYLIIVSILQALTKKTGVYFVLLCNLALLVIPEIRKNKYYRNQILLSIFIPIFIIFILFKRILFPLLNIYPGGKQEILGICFQQVARVVMDHESSISAYEKEVISNIFDYENVKEIYLYYNTDGVKETYNFYATSEQLKEFMKVWISLGIRHPLSYIRAILGTCGDNFCNETTIYIYKQIPADNIVNLKNSDVMINMRNAALSLYDWLKTRPIISTFFYQANYIYWLPLLSFLHLFKNKDYKKLILLVPSIVSLLVLIVSPRAYTRYSIHLIYTFPLILSLFAYKKEESILS